MKRKITFLSAAFMLLAFLAIPLGMWGQDPAPVNTVLWAEDFSGYSDGDVPSGEVSSNHTGTTVYNGGSVTYSCVSAGSTTKVYDANLAGGTSPELLVSKKNSNGNGSFTIEGIPTGDATELTLIYKTNNTNNAVSSPTTGVDVNEVTSKASITRTWTISTGGASTITLVVTNSASSNTRVDDFSLVVKTAGGGSQLTPCDLALVDASVELEFDLYDNADAQTVSYTTSSTGEVTVSQSNYITATVNANNTITVTPVAVTNGPQTITVNQASDGTYEAGSVTFTVDIEDSTPSTGNDVTFDATVDKDEDGDKTIVKDGVTFSCTNGALGNGTEYRLYKNSTTTFSVTSGTITKIVFTGVAGNPASGFASQTGWTTNGNNGTWTGSATSVSFTASGAQVRATEIVVTVETSGTPDPTISASNVDIAYDATNGSIAYTINNEPSPAGTLTAAVTDGNWLTLGQGTTSPIAFTCSANENTNARTATVTLTYTYNTDQTVSANVTVTQAAAPLIYTTIPDLFAAATTTETAVLVTFNNWVVSGVSTNGKNVFVTDNNGNGFVIFDNNGGLENTYTAGDILAGTAVSCNLKKYNGFAELLNVDASNLTITTGGTVTVASIDMANLAGVNTGALVHYDNLTCSVNNNKYYLSDGTTTLQVYNALFAFEALEDGETYNITGVYQQYNNTKEVLPRSADDIEEVTSATPTITISNATVNAPAEGVEGSLTVTYENITTVDADVWFCDAAGTTTATYNWITADINAQNNVEYLVESNNGEARTAYFKVWAYDDEFNEVYSDLVTINQAAYVAPTYAALPFAFDGGKADIENTDGLYQEGLGTDYNSSPYLKFDGEGDYVLLQFNEQPGTLTFDIKGNGSGADPWDGVFKVMVSTDGVDYTDKAVYQTGDLTGTKTTMTISDLASGVRYIKWIYTTKTKGNVALGNIALANVPATYDLTVTFGDSIAAIYVFNADEQSAPLIENGAAGNVSVSAGTSILVSPDAADGYELASLIVNNEDVTSQMNEGSYTFAMPASAVTITATATAIPTVVYAYSRNGVESDYVEVPQNTVIQLESADNLAPNDFTFAGWTTNANDVTNLLAAGSDFTLDDTYEFFAVYAHTTGGVSTAKEGASYVKVTSTDEIEDGNYLIVYEDGAVAFDGGLETLDATSNTIDIFDYLNNDVIESNGTTDAAIFVIAEYNQGYSIQSASGFYIGRASNTNGMDVSDVIVYENTITFNAGDVDIIGSNGAYMRYNATSGQERFRYFKSSTYSSQEAIQLYKYVGGSTPTPTPVTTYYTRVFLDETVAADITIAGPSIVPNGQTLNMGTYTLNNDTYDNLIIEDGGQLKIANQVNGTIQKNVAGYGTSTNDNYVLLATPASMDACNNTGMWPTTGSDHQAIQANIDFYSFDQSAELEWQNFKYGYSYFAGPYLMARGKGYLYANPDDVTLTLQTRGYSSPGIDYQAYPFEPTDEPYTVPSSELGYTATATWAGWNLVGNPFTCDAYLNRTYFRMNDTGDAIVEGDGAIKPCEGVFVVVTAEDKVVKFSDTPWLTSPSLSLNLNDNNQLMDRVSLHFDGSNNIKKFVLSENASKLYIQQGTIDYAVVRSNAEGEMPVSFKAENNGSYTISVNAENVEMNYLHLIDNLTGADIDLLVNPSYSFEAKTTDYASRFRLVFNANTVNENSNETFAYYNGSEWVISNMGEATLQVVDMMGRVLSTETVSGNATMNTNSLSAGIYMMRLINGNDVKVQKIVVR